LDPRIFNGIFYADQKKTEYKNLMKFIRKILRIKIKKKGKFFDDNLFKKKIKKIKKIKNIE
jgi:hypothetical protein